MAQLSSTRVRDIAFHLASEIRTIASLNELVGRIHEHTLNGVNASDLHGALWKPPQDAEQGGSVDHTNALFLGGDESKTNTAYNAFLAYTTNGIVRAHGESMWFVRGLEVMLHVASWVVEDAQRRAVANNITCIDTGAEEIDSVCKLARQDTNASAMKIQAILARRSEHAVRVSAHVWDRLFAQCSGDRFTKLIRVHARDAGYPIVVQLAINTSVRMRVLVAALVGLGLVQIAEAVVRDAPNIPLHTPPATTASALFTDFYDFQFLLECTHS